jgi:small-conductance mechanosensitive channel
MMAVVVLAATGCQSPSNLFGTNPQAIVGADQNQSNQNQSTQNQSTQNQSTQNQSVPGQSSDGEQASKPIDVSVQSLEPGAEKAGQLLDKNFEGFLSRRDFGFDRRLPGLVLKDLERLGERATYEAAAFVDLDARNMATELLPAVTLLLLLIIFALVDRASLRWAKRWQARVHLDFSRMATRLSRASILMAGRITPLVVLVLLSYFPVQALAQEALWSQLLTRILWLGVAYRAIRAAFVVTFSGDLSTAPREDARRLESYCTWVTRLIFGFLLVLAAVEISGYRSQSYFFILFCLNLIVAFVPIYLFFIQSSVMALFPDYEGSRLYNIFRSVIHQYYHWILSATILLLLMRAGGFVKASTFILVRGYAIILLVIVAFVLAHAIKGFLRRRTEAIDAEQKVGERAAEAGPPQLAKSLEQLLYVAGGIVLVVIILETLAVREAVIALLRTPIVVAGNVQISLFNVLSVGLIIFGTILGIKIVKAVLNAKVYPALSVDVGIAYALNTLLSYVLVVVGFLMVLAAIGVHLSAIAVVLASLGVGIGFGLQSLTENLISGFIILFGRSVKKGDFITVNDTYGRVEAVGARSVVIRTPDNYDMLIPSKEIVGGHIINWTFRDSVVRIRIDVGVGYNADPPHVKEVLLKVASDSELILDEPQAEVWLDGFGDSSVNFQLLVHYDCRNVSPMRLKGRINFTIWEALQAADIEIPFPQRDIHVRTGEVLPEVAKMLREYRDASDSSADDNLIPPTVDMESDAQDTDKDAQDTDNEDDEDGKNE